MSDLNTTRLERERLAKDRLERDGDRWRLEVWRCESGLKTGSCEFEDLPQHIKEPLAVLLTTHVGYYNERIGRRVSEDVFWVYHE